MTIIEAINRIDELKPNSYTYLDKIGWLSNLDGAIKKNIIDTHEDGEDITFTGYNNDTPDDTELLVKAPYDEIYLYWLESRIDYYNGEMAKYNNSAAMFNNAYAEYANYINRKKMPLTKAEMRYF